MSKEKEKVPVKEKANTKKQLEEEIVAWRDQNIYLTDQLNTYHHRILDRNAAIEDFKRCDKQNRETYMRLKEDHKKLVHQHTRQMEILAAARYNLKVSEGNAAYFQDLYIQQSNKIFRSAFQHAWHKVRDFFCFY